MPTLFHAVLNAFQAFLNGIQPNIKKADINSLTPMEAMNLLYQLKSQLDEK